MNKNFIAVLIVCAFHTTSQACDICGCNIASGFGGILPNFKKNFYGIRYTGAAYTSEHPGEATLYKDRSNTFELWGRFYVHPRMLLNIALPYNIKKSIGETSYSSKGAGDISLSAGYIIIQRKTDSGRLQHLLQAGAGIKLPTGAYRLMQSGNRLPAPMQPGTGSTDILLNALYIWRINHSGISSDIGYRINNVNPSDYAFGNKLNASSRWFYTKKTGKNCNLMPSAGVLLEMMGPSQQYGRQVQDTGGTICSSVFGLEINSRRWVAAAFVNIPLAQNLNHHMTHAQGTIQINTGFIF